MHDAIVEKELALGLVANGSAGPWDVSVDETTEGASRWFLQLDGPAVSLFFEIDSPSIIDRVVHFLEQPSVPRAGTSDSTTGEEQVSVGHFGPYAVLLVRDNEYADRYFFIIGPSANTTIRIGLVGEDIGLVMKAFRQVREDLQDSGLL